MYCINSATSSGFFPVKTKEASGVKTSKIFPSGPTNSVSFSIEESVP